MQKATHAAVAAPSFESASRELLVLAEADVSACRLRRLVERIGNERVQEVQQQTQAYQELPLPAQQDCPVLQAPEVVSVQCDGGRMQVRDRHETTPRAEGYWRETKTATLLKMRGDTYDSDPCPQLPKVFIEATRMRRLVREIKGFSGDKAAEDSSAKSPEKLASSEPPPEQPLLSPDELHAASRPQPVLRSVVASTANIHEFGEQVVAAAYARGFHAAKRKAFVGDGMACNWTLHEKHFSRYTPILDFVHALCYVYHAALAGRDAQAGWSEYCDWAQWLWSGEIERLIEAIARRQEELGSPEPTESDSSPRSQVAAARTYLQNQRSRMDYSRYRREGLPITSAYVESAIKQLNRRVKGTEKFWSVNAPAIVQLRADFLSETLPLRNFWKNRPQKLSSNTQYRMAG
jgi:hypothetical protein